MRAKHGLSQTQLYRCWYGIIQRCDDSKNRAYKWYGGRGISICDEWKNSLETFYSWAMANGFQKGLTIDRINNDGNYEPSNCRWVTRKVNLNNMRRPGRVPLVLKQIPNATVDK